MQRLSVLETCLYAHDLEKAEEFYRGLFGLEVIGREDGRHVFFRCGQGVFLVFNPEQTSRPGMELPPHGSRGPGHVAFAVGEQDLSFWRSRLESLGVPIELDHLWPSGKRSLYFRDPAGNSVELASPRIWSMDEDS